MNIVFRTTLLALVAWLASTIAVAETTEPEIGIVNRTDCGGFWRYDFNYETVDTDGETPIVLSAAIFMLPEVHDKTVKAKGCGLLNHYTITADKDCPTHVSGVFTMEGILSGTNYFIIESDGFGFGIDVEHNQKYLQGRATARANIDAFLAGRKLLEEEGYEWSNVTLNLGYSQGGHSGMWVNRLVAEGYRSEELPKIDYCIIGGGSYDMYAHYQQLAQDNLTQYPVAIPLICSGMMDAGGSKVKNEDLFTDDLVTHLSELYDTKLHDTDYINDFILGLYGHADDRELPIDQMMKPAFFDESSEVMEEIICHLKQNSLVYDSWKPENTDRITFVHSKNDEVVPYVNQENMASHLLESGYETFDIDDSCKEKHTDTGTYYVLKAFTLINAFVPSGMEDVFSEMPGEQTHDIYSLDGRLVRKQTTLSEAYRSLPKGIYVINGQKVMKQ